MEDGQVVCISNIFLLKQIISITAGNVYYIQNDLIDLMILLAEMDWKTMHPILRSSKK